VGRSQQALGFAAGRALGPADPAPTAGLSATRTVGSRAVGDAGALLWVAEQLDLVGHIDRACGGGRAAKSGPSVGEVVLGVALQRACAPGPKCDLTEFLENSVPRASCLPAASHSATGQVSCRSRGVD